MQACFLEVDAEVRYWEDTSVDGKPDADGTLIPLRTSKSWAPVIRLADGLVQDWPTGTAARVHYKVCDQGSYWLLDDHRVRIAQWRGNYVPDEFLCQSGDGFGDYIVLDVGADGLIDGWKRPPVKAHQWILLTPDC